MSDLHARAKRLLVANQKTGVKAIGGEETEFSYACPAVQVYPHQWLWDSCFHAIVQSRFDPQRARAELRTLLSSMREDGFIPHIIPWGNVRGRSPLSRGAEWIYRRSHFANVTQPPVLGVALAEYYRATGDADFARAVLPLVKRHYQYFTSHRDPDGDGLISIVFPIESGMDHLPTYDALLGRAKPSALNYHVLNVSLLLRYAWHGWDLRRIFAADRFVVEDIGFNCLYAFGLRALSELCRELGDAETEQVDDQWRRVEEAILTQCYDPTDGFFYSLCGRKHQMARVKTVASLLTFLLPSLPASAAERMINDYVLDPKHFWTAYPVPSVSLSEASFAPSSRQLPSDGRLSHAMTTLFAKRHLIWRGPTWVNTNWLLARGLRLHGYHAIADELTTRTAEMIRLQGFWEYYNPLTGVGEGAQDFGWSTLVVDMLDDHRLYEAAASPLPRLAVAIEKAAS